MIFIKCAHNNPFTSLRTVENFLFFDLKINDKNNKKD